jgi:hydrogenase maturation protein HypF
MPYDRQLTTMAPFPTCLQCAAEFTTPDSRRFHAELIACHDCGPRYRWHNTNSDSRTQIQPLLTDSRAAINCAQAAIERGELVAVKSVGGYQLICDASNHSAVLRLRSLKQRNEKPFALMARSIEMIRRYASPSASDSQLLLSPHRPIVLLPTCKSLNGELPCDPIASISPAVAPGTYQLGFMLPPSPLHELLVQDRPLVCTSANRSNSPLVIDDEQAIAQFLRDVAGILTLDREIVVRCDDSVWQSFGDYAAPIRLGRGYIPHLLQRSKIGPPVLAIGGEQKAAVALAYDQQIVLGPHVGDLDNWDTQLALQDSVDHLTQLLQVKPSAIVCDAHPGYQSQQWASEYAASHGIPLIKVFHHEAHAASLQVDQCDFDHPFLAFCFDGTGLGRDRTICGSECLLVSRTQMQRVAHLRPFSLPKSDIAAEQPAIAALAMLGSFDFPWDDSLAATSIPQINRDLLQQQLTKQLLTIPCSSMGRLFDALAAILGIRQQVNYSGQAACELEAVAAQADTGCDYAPYVNLLAHAPNVPWQIDVVPLIEAILVDIRKKRSLSEIALGFHQWIVQAMLEVACALRQKAYFETVGLTGGTFQNKLLTQFAITQFQQAGFRVWTHKQIPCNDGGLAVGQIHLFDRADQGLNICHQWLG